MNLRNSFKKGLRWNVGNGEAISFWYDNWTYNYPIVEVCLVARGSKNFQVSHLINQDRQWDKLLLGQFVPIEIVDGIIKILITRNQIPDKFCWGLSPYGIYSIKSGVVFFYSGLIPRGLNHQLFNGFGNWKFSLK